MPLNLGLVVGVVTVLLVAVGTAIIAWSARSPSRGAVPRRADTLMDAVGQAVVLFDAEGRVVRANPRWYELIGRSPAEVVGVRPPFPWQSTEGPDDHVTRPDGSQVPVLGTTAPVPGARGGSVATYLDITDRRKIEDALAEQAATLERGNEQLRETNRRLERAAAFKNDLMALVSHEMSQPLSSSASLAELLADSWDTLPEDTRLDLTLKIHRNTRRLVGMVNDMLLLFHLDSGTVTARRTPVPVGEAVDVAAATLPEGTEVERRLDPAVDALVDRNHLEQIIGNLLANAATYGQPPIEVVSGWDGSGVRITVTDRGPGIPDEIRQQLFERPVRPKATGTGSGRGRGLGLFIARHLTEVNGGRIWYERAEPHGGARLLVWLESTATD